MELNKKIAQPSTTVHLENHLWQILISAGHKEPLKILYRIDDQGNWVDNFSELKDRRNVPTIITE